MPGTGQRRAYGSKLATQTSVEVRRLDRVLTADAIQRPALMKLDVQGGELDVLKGCGALLDSIDAILLEGSFVELYEGQVLVADIIAFLRERGFEFRGVHNASYTADYGPTQADFLFTRTSDSARVVRKADAAAHGAEPEPLAAANDAPDVCARVDAVVRAGVA
jgi:hypothetical protein